MELLTSFSLTNFFVKWYAYRVLDTGKMMLYLRQDLSHHSLIEKRVAQHIVTSFSFISMEEEIEPAGGFLDPTSSPSNMFCDVRLFNHIINKAIEMGFGDQVLFFENTPVGKPQFL